MNNDLVTRLRSMEVFLMECGISPVAHFAADRIEELEKELAEANRQIKELENELDNIEYEMCELENRHD